MSGFYFDVGALCQLEIPDSFETHADPRSGQLRSFFGNRTVGVEFGIAAYGAFGVDSGTRILAVMAVQLVPVEHDRSVAVLDAKVEGFAVRIDSDGIARQGFLAGVGKGGGVIGEARPSPGSA